MHLHTTSVEARARSMAAFDPFVQEAQTLVADNDAVIAGDFNTSGCPDREPEIESIKEISDAMSRLAAHGHPLDGADGTRHEHSAKRFRGR